MDDDTTSEWEISLHHTSFLLPFATTRDELSNSGVVQIMLPSLLNYLF